MANSLSDPRDLLIPFFGNFDSQVGGWPGWVEPAPTCGLPDLLHQLDC